MPNPRPLRPVAMDSEWLRRSQAFLNRSLLFAILILIALVFGSAGPQLGAGPLTLPLPELIVLSVGAAWLAIAYMLGRRGRLQAAGGLVVALVMLLVGMTIYMVPDRALALLSLAALPVALAALLLRSPGVYIAAIATVIVVGAAMLLAAVAPPAQADPVGTLATALGAPRPDPTSLALSATGVTLLLLALVLAPLRATAAAMFGVVREAEAARGQADLGKRTAEQSLDEMAAELELQRRHLQAIAERATDGLLAADRDGRIVRANPVAHELWAEVGRGDLVGASLDSLKAALAAGPERAQPAELAELPPALVSAGGFTHLLRDRREEARYARLRSELLGLLTDEMRNPLTSMLTALDLTLGQTTLPEDVDRVLIGARRSGQRLLDLVTILLEMNQIEQDPASLRRSAVSLRRVLDAAIAQMSPIAQQSAVTVAVEYGGEGQIVVDSERTQRAFVFLLEHALRHSPPYSTVQVRTERQNGSVVVRITDQGPSLTSAERESLFDRSGVAGVRGAPALGLAFSKLVIESHGGRIWPESGAGQGSTCAFSLPAA